MSISNICDLDYFLFKLIDTKDIIDIVQIKNPYL